MPAGRDGKHGHAISKGAEEGAGEAAMYSHGGAILHAAGPQWCMMLQDAPSARWW